MELAFSRALAVRRISNSAVSRMRLVQLQGQGGGVAGIAALGKDGQVLLLNKADPSLPKTLIEVLKNGALDKCKQ